MEESTQLVGTVDKVIYKSPDTHFSVITLKVDSSSIITAKGVLIDIHPGEILSLTGSWLSHPKFGRQFEITEYSKQVPTSAIGIEKYLASGLVKGIGPKFAERLVARFGPKTLEIIEHHPERLAEVSGVGQKRIDAITTAWQEQREIAKVMVFLKEKDVSTAFAVKIFKTYGSQSIETITKNPYRLVDDIWGIGFKSADQIALKLGLATDAPDRVKAGILHCIADATNNGNLYVEVQETKDKTIEMLALSAETHAALLKRSLSELYTQGKIKLISHEENHYLSLPQYYYAEKGISTKISKLLSVPFNSESVDLKVLYDAIRQPDTFGKELNEDQQRGILACFQNRVTIITGGPGTGKTTLVKKLLEMLDSIPFRYQLAAPTGRAAKRMFEGTGRNTATLHRLLEFTPASMGFLRNENNALVLDFLIIDEASMIDVFLMNSLLKALPEKSHLILLGDVDQLPSVGAGNVLNDLIASEKICVVRLTQIFRQARDSMIVVNAHRVNHGEFPIASQPDSRRDFSLVSLAEPEDFFPLLRQIYEKKLPAAGISPDDAVVLTPMNRGSAGTVRINQELQAILNPETIPNKSIARFNQLYKVKDRVMQIKNNYDKFVFNGDIGTIIDIDLPNQTLNIMFGEREHEYDFSDLNELTLAYAISIHKSQGSEFGAVIIPLFMQHFMLLQRNLLYTAITRAKRICFLAGQTKAIAMCVKNNKNIKRLTFLKEYLTTTLEAR